MNLFKSALILLLCAILMASCTVNINYPGSGIIEYLTADSDAETALDEPTDAVEEVSESAEPCTDTGRTVETVAQKNPEQDTTIKETEAQTTVNETDEYIPPIHLAYITSPISKNKTATVDIIGEPNTEYSIEVFYATGKSSAKGLENKISDDIGAVSWNWKMGPSVKSGYYKIIITGGGSSLETEIQVY